MLGFRMLIRCWSQTTDRCESFEIVFDFVMDKIFEYQKREVDEMGEVGEVRKFHKFKSASFLLFRNQLHML